MKVLNRSIVAMAALALCASAHAQRYEMRTSTPTLAVSSPVRTASLSTTALNFGDVAVGQSGIQSFGVLNSGNEPLSLSGVTVSDPAFTATTSCGSSLAPGAQCPVQVKFNPTAGQPYSANATVSTNAAGSPLIVKLTGKGLQATIALKADTSGDLGQVTVGTSTSRTFTLTNSGTAPANNVVATVIGSNRLALTSNTCGTSAAPVTVQAGSTCAVTVTYTPTSAETLNDASLTVTSSAVGSPARQPLTGSAVAPTDPYFANVSLLMHMDGANGSNSFVDAKGHSFSVAGAPTISTTNSKFGGASASFNGSSYIQTGYSSAYAFTGDFTVELWANISAHPTYAGLISGASSTSWNGWQIIFDNTTNNLRFEGSGNTAMVSSSPLPMNSWAHVALVRQGTGANNLKLYINGTQVGAVTYSGTMDSGGTPLRIGAERTATYAITGFIDDVRITSGVARYTGNFTPPATAHADQ